MDVMATDRLRQLVALMLLTAVLLALLWVPAPVRAHAADLRFTHFTTDDGLSSSVIDAALQDRQGFLWFGTQEGLNRFDGTTFTVYRHNPSDPHSLSDNWVHALAEDHDGTLWVGTRNGLNRFDPATRNFTRFLHDPTDPHSLASMAVPCLYPEAAGTIWVCAGSGLDRLDPTSGDFTHYEFGLASSNTTLVALYPDGPDQFWLGGLGGGLNGGLVRFQPSTGTFTHFVHDPANPYSLAHNNVWSIMRDRAGRLWVGTGDGLHLFDETSARFTRLQHDAERADSLPGQAVYALHEDRQGRFWVGTNDYAARFDPDLRTFETIPRHLADPTSFAGSEVDTIYEDRAGLLWFGTRSSGLNLLDPWNNSFQIYRRQATNPEGMLSDKVDVLTVDSAGAVWIGAKLGLSRLDLASGQFTHYRKDIQTPGALPADVSAILEDRAGTLWVGTYSKGLFALDRASGTFRSYASPQAAIVTTLYEDAHGMLWIGSNLGLTSLDAARQQFTFYQSDHATTHITAILPDRDGGFWLGDWGGGLAHFDPATGTFRYQQHDPADPTSLSNNNVMALYEDRAGRIWVATRSGGLNRFDRASGRFRHYGTAEGMPSAIVLGVREDSDGQIWVSTRGGLVRLDPTTDTLRVFTTRDGLPSNEFEWRADAATPDGQLLFGGFGGLVVVDPTVSHDNPYPPPVYLTELLLFNQPVPVGGTILPRDLSQTAALSLSYRDSVVTFGFAALSFSAPERTRYAYMLEGFDQSWQYVDSTRRFATYTNLPPGAYAFRVRAANSAGVWGEAGALLGLTIIPPFWQTAWFLGVAGFLTLCATFGFDRWRSWRGRVARRELTRRVTERTAALEQAHARLEGETARRAAAEAAQREQLHRILDTLPGMVCIFDLEREDAVYFNHGVTMVLGYQPEQFSNLAPQFTAELVHPEDRTTLRIWLRTLATLPPGTTAAQSVRMRHAHGEWRHILHQVRPFALEVTVRVTQLLVLSSDITERIELERALRHLNEELEQRVTRRTHELTHANLQLANEMRERQQTEAQLRQVQKIEAIGRLAGGIAHDFNNLLTIMFGATGMVLDDLPDDSPLRPDLLSVVQAAQRGASLTRQLLAFSRQQVLAPHVYDLNLVVSEAAHLFRRLIGADIALTLDLCSELGAVLVDKSQIEQVLMNLVVNARDAMPEGGRMYLRTFRMDLDAAQAQLCGLQGPGPVVALEVQDTGTGMDAITLERIFEPFFSTKPAGRGTGLGLATVYGIVSQSGGGIAVASTLGQGSTFTIYLPELPKIDLLEAVTPNVTALKGKGTILLVEDEDDLRAVVGRVLRSYGYTVLEASSGAAALTLAHAQPNGIDLLLTDVVHAGGLDGVEIARMLRFQRPDLAVLFVTGYAGDALDTWNDPTLPLQILAKPFALPQLAQAVRRVIAREGLTEDGEVRTE